MNLSRIKERIAYFRSHSFVRNAAVLQIGNISANVIQAGIGIFLARILQPERFGVYALSFGLAGLISIILGVGAQDAVITILGERYARQDREGITDALAFLAKISLILGLAALVGAFLAPALAKVFYHNTQIGMYAGIIVGASILSTSFFAMAAIGLQVVGEIRVFTYLAFADQMSRSILSLSFVALGLGVFGSVMGHFIGAALLCISSAILWRWLHKKYALLPSLREIMSHIRQVRIKPYFGFSFWIAIDRNISNLYNILPIVITGMYVARADVTYFKLAFAYVNLALSFLAPISTLLNVSFPKMKVDSAERLRDNFIKVSLYSLALSAVLTAGALIAAPIAFHVIYGSNFTPSVHYVWGLFFYGSLMGIGVGLGSISRALQKVKVSIMINLCVLGAGVPLAVVLIKRYGLWGSVISVSLWYTVSHWVTFLYFIGYLKRREAAMTS